MVRALNSGARVGEVLGGTYEHMLKS